MNKKGKLFTFEGQDGAGKTTLARAFTERLNAAGLECEYYSFPGQEAGTVGSFVYDLHHNPHKLGFELIGPTSLQLLHIAAHIDAIESRIIPALKKGRSVVLDRFWWSTWVYGVVNGIDKRSLQTMIELERFHWGKVRPTIAFLVRRKPPITEDLRLPWKKLSAEYKKLAARECHKYPVRFIDNEKTIEESLSVIARLAGLKIQSANVRREQSGTDICGQGKFQFDVCRDNKPKLLVFSKIAPAKPTIVYDTFWRFAAERQAIFFARLAGNRPPWTKDPILRDYKFTNAYRASDRVSQYLIKHILYEGDELPKEVFFRALLFKIFNKIETWELLKRELGTISFSSYSFKHYDEVLTTAMEKGFSVYSAAYIMPSGGKSSEFERKHRMHLKLIERMIQEELPEQLMSAPSMNKAFELLRSYPTIGDFLAYQFVTDLNYSTLLNFSEMEFVVAGPGAFDGISKCFNDLGGLNESEIIKVVTDRQDEEFKRRGLIFQTLWGRPLQLIDCQNLFCEVGKYARLKHPEIVGSSDRKRIKQKFRSSPLPLSIFYPPKWGLNQRIHSQGNRGRHDKVSAYHNIY